MRDPYEFLGVPRSATADDIKRSFRLQAKILHPDANKNNPKAAGLFVELNAAHEILGDEAKRRSFDQGEIDAEGKPTRRALPRRSKPSMSHIVTSLMAVMVMLFITATLIMRGLSPDENINAKSEGGNRALSAIEAKEEPAAQTERPGPAVQSTPRLILQQSVSYAAADSVPLGIQVSGQVDGLALEISGLPSETTISLGRQLGGGGWHILAADVGNAMIHPPPGFSGTIDLAIVLRLIDDTVVDRGSLHFEWLQKPAVAAERIESADARPASESSGGEAPAIPPPTDQNAVHDAMDLHRDHEPVDLLIGRSKKLIAPGDVEAVRTLLQPAAEARDARAALPLGATYDPIMLAILQGRGATADVSLAPDWYKKAQEFGSVEAQGRLKVLSARAAEPKRHVLRAPIHVAVSHEMVPRRVVPRVAAPPHDLSGVYVAGDRVGAIPDPSIRARSVPDDASPKLRALLGVSY